MLLNIPDYLEAVLSHICLLVCPFNTLQSENIRGEIVDNFLKVIVLPRLKSRFPSDLNTDFNSEMILNALENRPIMLSSSKYCASMQDLEGRGIS